MTDTPQGFVKIKDVPKDFKTSRRTIERRRKQAYDNNDTATLRNFKIVTRDGDVHDQPAKELVNDLIKQGRMPEWFVARQWLTKHFPSTDKYSETPPPNSKSKLSTEAGDSPAAVRHLYEERLADKEDRNIELQQRVQQLEDKLEKREQRFEEREKQLLDYSHQEKLILAEATKRLSEALALPAFSEASKFQQQDVQTTPRQTVINTTPKVEPKTEKPKQRKKSPAKAKQPAKEEPTTIAQRARRWLFGSE